MGALIGSFWASGLNADEIVKISQEYGTKRSLLSLIDFTVPKSGILTGQQVVKLLTRVLKDVTFRELRIPLKVVACDYTRREVVTLDQGSVVQAVRASISIPGVFEPVKIRGRHLIDGGVLDPVPVNTLLRLGVHKVIAVNALPSPEDMGVRETELVLQEKIREREARARSMVHWLSFKLGETWKRFKDPNILDVIVHTMQSMEYELAEAACARADVVLNPTKPHINWWEFHNAKQLIEEGQRQTELQLDSIKKLVFDV
jgi:NTE family protein